MSSVAVVGSDLREKRALYSAAVEEVARRLPDVSKIQRLIGYEPKLDLGEMLKRIIAQERTLARHAEHRA